MEKILLDNDKITIKLEGGIVNAKWKDTIIDLSTAKQAVKERLEITDNISFPIISNIIQVKNISKEARDYLATEEGCEGITAAAILINSALGSMLGNFWVRISKPLRPTRIFTNEEDAKKWLAKYT